MISVCDTLNDSKCEARTMYDVVDIEHAEDDNKVKIKK